MIDKGWRLRFLWAAVAAGPLGALSLAAISQSGVTAPLAARADPIDLLVALIVAPVAEEIVFRAGVQGILERWPERHRPFLGWIDRANLATSLLFALCHAALSPTWLSAAVVLPSLLLGRIKQLYGAVAPCIAVHAWFNVCFAVVFAR